MEEADLLCRDHTLNPILYKIIFCLYELRASTPRQDLTIEYPDLALSKLCCGKCHGILFETDKRAIGAALVTLSEYQRKKNEILLLFSVPKSQDERNFK